MILRVTTPFWIVLSIFDIWFREIQFLTPIRKSSIGLKKMIFLAIHFLLIIFIFSLVFIVFIFVQSLDLGVTFPVIGDFLVILLTFFSSYFIIIITLAIVNKVARILLGTEEGELDGSKLIWWTIKETSWDMAQTITKKIIFLSTSPIIISRLFGFRIRKNTGIVGHLMDPELLDIGEGTVVGTGAIVSAHHIRRGSLYYKRVKIGKNCLIGGLTVVLPGVVIPDNVIVSACSLIPANWELEPNTIYSGVPIKKIKEITEN
jgi:hypothetical protein